MCPDLDSVMRELEAKGVVFMPTIHDERWGRLATMVLPGGGELAIYEPRHPRAVRSRFGA